MKCMTTQPSVKALMSAVLAVILIGVLSTGAHAAPQGIVTRTVKGSFEKTVTKLKKAITANRLVIIKEIPFTQMLGMVGVKAEKIRSFEIFHPRFGKVVHANDKEAMMEVPFRILVREKGGGITIQYRKPSVLFAGYSGLSGLGSKLDQIFANIVDRVAK